MEGYLKNLIARGENQTLDFKFCITDSRKIARTLSAFANSDGGKLLIGVKDNGSIAGISSDEEYYMIETAVHLFCHPEIPFKIRQHRTGDKEILEVEVEEGNNKPYKVKDEDGKWKSYFRHFDQNLVANRIMNQVWKRRQKGKGVLIKFGKAENMLLDYLKKNGSVTLSVFRRIASIPGYRAEKIIVNLILCKVLSISVSDKGICYILNPDQS
jgi:predicted HTH transcriptional regulator